MAMEYPGYGIYRSAVVGEDRILEDAEIVFAYVVEKCGLKPDDIIVFGRSIGSGSATHIASTFNPGALALMSPFTSIKDVVHTLVGKAFAFVIKERFRNIDKIENVICPTFIVHG